MSAQDTVNVATSGTVDLHYQCEECDGPMLYYAPGGKVEEMFCGTYGCPLWLIRREIP